MLKQREVTIADRGRELNFRITEMNCIEAHRFIVRAARELLRTGIVNQELADEVELTKAVASALFNGGLEKLADIDPDAVDLLLGRLIACCEYKVDKAYTRMNWDNVVQYIESPLSLYKLAKEVLVLHLDFLQNANQSTTPPSAQESENHSTSKPAMFLKS